MKTIATLLLAAFLLIAASPPPADTSIKGAWQAIKSKYGDEKEYVDYEQAGIRGIKMFTGTQWSGVSYNLKEKKISGMAGGSYKIKGNQYSETVEYFSWDAATEGKTFVFTMTIENGMLHQFGYIDYKEDSKYLIDEWYKRID
jgi:hypothetical protein